MFAAEIVAVAGVMGRVDMACIATRAHVRRQESNAARMSGEMKRSKLLLGGAVQIPKTVWTKMKS